MDDEIDMDALRISVAEMLANECGRETVLRHAMEQGGPMHPLWQTACDLGWMALPVSESHGGMGLGLDALATIYLELGRVAAPLPFLVTMMATQAIQLGGTAAQQAEFLPLLASGTMATLSPPLAVAQPDMHIEFAGDDIILSGTAIHLVDARDAALCLLLASDQQGTTYRVILTAQDQLLFDTRRMWDPGHLLCSTTLDGMHLPRSRIFASGADLEGALLTHAAIGLAAEAVGGSEGLLALTIDYLNTRQQFGKPIGSFQALKHRVANHKTELVGARTLLRSAIAMAANAAPDAATEASAAKALACSVYANLARDSIQLHGGIGFTAEYACHLYLKRAHFYAHLFGDEAFHIRQTARTLLSGDAA